MKPIMAAAAFVYNNRRHLPLVKRVALAAKNQPISLSANQVKMSLKKLAKDVVADIKDIVTATVQGKVEDVVEKVTKKVTKKQSHSKAAE